MTKSNVVKIEDLFNKDKVIEIVLEIRNNGTEYTLIQDNIEIAVVGPKKRQRPPEEEVSEELTKQRFEALKEMEEIAERVSELCNSEQSSAEIVSSMRRW